MRWILSCLLLLSAASWSAPAVAAPPADATVKASAQAIKEGQYGAAIREAEAAADRGVVHPDSSFNRGLAYLRRAQEGSKEPGDLAQAAAGFAEALELRPGDAEAERGLENARLLIAQDRSGADTSPQSSSLGLLERVLLSIPPLILALFAGLGSVACAIGILLLASTKESKKLSGTIAALVGALLLLPALVLFFLRHSLFDEVRVAVVIADSAEVVDESGKRIPGRLPFRKGTLLHLDKSSRELVPLVGLTEDGHVPIARVRVLKTAP